MSHPSSDSIGPSESFPREATQPPGEDVLPPVQPPGAGFIMQLFFIPLIIVAILVSVWLMFSWLAHMGSRPEQIVDDFQRLNDATWQKALTLANMLRDPSNDALRRDARLAQRLATILQQQTDAGHSSESHLRFRMYLCRALGEFHVVDGLPALIDAANQASSLDQWQVRRAALEAIGLLIDHVGASQVERNENLLPVLRQIAIQRGDQPAEQQPRAKLRATAAFVLGLLERDEGLPTLVALLDDPVPLVRYNAAAGLARRGDARALPQLLEMLDPNTQDQLAASDTPPAPGATPRSAQDTPANDSEAAWNRTHVLSNALRAARRLAEVNTAADLAPLESAVSRLLGTDLDGALRVEAQQLFQTLAARKRLARTQWRRRSGHGIPFHAFSPEPTATAHWTRHPVSLWPSL